MLADAKVSLSTTGAMNMNMNMMALQEQHDPASPSPSPSESESERGERLLEALLSSRTRSLQAVAAFHDTLRSQVHRSRRGVGVHARTSATSSSTSGSDHSNHGNHSKVMAAVDKLLSAVRDTCGNMSYVHGYISIFLISISLYGLHLCVY